MIQTMRKTVKRLKVLVICVSLIGILFVHPAVAFAAEVVVSAGDDATELTAAMPDGVIKAGLTDTDIHEAQVVDYTDYLVQLQQDISLNNELLQYVAGFGLFFVIVALCFFGYKFFRMFF